MGTQRVGTRVGALAGFLLVLACVLAPRPAGAHALLARSQPANGSTVAVTPDVVRLWFNEEISTELSTLRLVDRTGAAVPGTRGHADARALELQVPDLARGTYGVFWRVLAEDDGHTSSGTVVFSVGASNGALAATSGGGTSATALDTARRWLGLCLLAGVIGGLAVAYLVLGRIRRRDGLDAAIDSARRRLLGGVIACAALGSVVAAVDAVAQARRLASGRSWPATLGDLLASSRWGHLWAVREAVLIALVPLVIALRARGRRSQAVAALALALTLAGVEALGSHAATVGSSRGVAIVSDAAHILAACVWLGALPALVVLLLAPTRRRDLVRAGREPFTVLLAGSVALVVTTGLYNAGRQVENVGDLTSTSYGRTLLVKTALLAVMLALGLGSARHWHGMSGGPVRRMVAVEAAVGATLLVAVAVLAGTPPARGDDAGSAGQSRSTTVADLLVTVSAAPNRPGANGVTVLVASSRRPPPAPVSAVTLDVGTQPGVRLTPVGLDRYFGTVELAPYGDGQLRAVLQRGGEQLTATVPWSVAGPGAHGRRLAPYVDGLALGLLAGAALIGVGYARRRRGSGPPRQEPVATLVGS